MTFSLLKLTHRYSQCRWDIYWKGLNFDEHNANRYTNEPDSPDSMVIRIEGILVKRNQNAARNLSLYIYSLFLLLNSSEFFNFCALDYVVASATHYHTSILYNM